MTKQNQASPGFNPTPVSGAFIAGCFAAGIRPTRYRFGFVLVNLQSRQVSQEHHYVLRDVGLKSPGPIIIHRALVIG